MAFLTLLYIPHIHCIWYRMAEHELSALAKCCRHIIIKSLKTFQITLVKVGNEMIDQRNEREQKRTRSISFARNRITGKFNGFWFVKQIRRSLYIFQLIYMLLRTIFPYFSIKSISVQYGILFLPILSLVNFDMPFILSICMYEHKKHTISSAQTHTHTHMHILIHSVWLHFVIWSDSLEKIGQKDVCRDLKKTPFR